MRVGSSHLQKSREESCYLLGLFDLLMVTEHKI